ncbi:ATP-binding cassette domain-containing protein [Amycolatopsis acidiphila]|uniref:ABC-F family ATP-binding cassette domain-containing protein n=1 Tax=Amycolatopsis acidiphila TaxID=715473 RepID=A0A558A776_9PSEU|nr:ATP-binding cassette domain-containing protein [Amycolatopsis acidiphila]TVT20119.1 ABC-F family ATP-binding cassette domain-containing protein [Amycolatopsis acidiphila]UIJ62858.1 ATP-binding cassette domain-containing protein [Amycolatopsis acidiphila]GHG64671.1 ABC transporter ATP-binding protein [Amycolatopsis acidiphila]
MRALDLVFSYGDHVVFDGFSLIASPGRRIGLVGENGAGKSTLLRLLAGLEEPLAGRVERGPDVGFLMQELPFPGDATVSGVVDHALAEIRAATARLDTLAVRLAGDAGALAEYGRTLEWAQAHDLWDADRRAELVLAGLGLGAIAPTRRLETLSGGQRSRLGLAALLIRQPETLLLDEPTNHLDDAGMEFLERHLSALTGIVVLSSHDRVFLDAVCTDIVDLDPALGGPARYGGAYSQYLVHKRAERARWEQRHVEEQDELKQLRESVAVTARGVAHDRPQRDNAKTLYDFKTGRVQKQISRRVRNAQQRLDELTRAQVRKPPAPLRFAAPLTGRGGTGEPVLSVRDAHVPGRLHIGQLDVPDSARLLVTGGNGAGKSTLLTLLAGTLAPARGVVHRRRGVRVGLLEQDVAVSDPAKTPRQLYAEAGPGALPLAQLGLLRPRDLDRPAGVLSVGQRRRLALAVLVARPPDVLLLDEPTNHISLPLAEELFDALGTAPGAVVIASHDRWLRREWQGSRLRLDEGRVG